MNLDKLLYKGGDPMIYAASMASTWIWAPAIFVAASMGYFYGWAGVALFSIPNALAILFFGVFAAKAIRDNPNGVTFLNALETALKPQRELHLGIGLVVTACSTIVQLLGMHLLLSAWLDIPIIASALFVSAISLVIVWRHGLKGSIISDYWKWLVTVVCGGILVGFLLADPSVSFSHAKVFDPSDLGYLASFGLTATIGWWCAPYADQTFWQRAFSCGEDGVKFVFGLAALMFVFVPILFGMVGLLSASTGIVDGWTVASAFGTSWLGIVLGVAVFCALLSTLDSNLCAVQSIAETEFGFDGRIAMLILLGASSVIVSVVPMTIAGLFLLYGTIRTCAAVPTFLITFKRFDPNRLLIGSVLSVVLGAGGYAAASLIGFSQPWIFTVLALILPMIGYRTAPKQTILLEESK